MAQAKWLSMVTAASGIEFMLICVAAVHSPTAAGRVYAAYGGVYIGVAICWLWLVDAVKPSTTDLIGVAVCLLGTGIVMLGSKTS